MIKPANNVYHDADATMESNIIGSGLIDYLDDELRYSTNVLVLKDYIGVPDVSNSGTIGASGVTYSNCIVIDNNNLRGYSLKTIQAATRIQPQREWVQKAVSSM